MNGRTVTETKAAKFAIGQLIQHRLFEYRGVIIDVDPHFKGTSDWYDTVARSRPPKDTPWYHVLVDDAELRTYVAERNLGPDSSGQPINHPDIIDYFSGLGETGYLPRHRN